MLQSRPIRQSEGIGAAHSVKGLPLDYEINNAGKRDVAIKHDCCYQILTFGPCCSPLQPNGNNEDFRRLPSKNINLQLHVNGIGWRS